MRGHRCWCTHKHSPKKVKKRLSNTCTVTLGMRYGNPSIQSAVSKLTECDSIVILPLFPQYSLAATESAIQKALNVINKSKFNGDVNIIKDFYNHPVFIQSQADLVRKYKKPDTHVLFSYHGLPERHLDKVATCKNKCDRTGNCPAISEMNEHCYRAQCYETTKSVANACQLKEREYSTSFQSRLGKLPWIKPYTDEWLNDLRKTESRSLLSSALLLCRLPGNIRRNQPRSQRTMAV